MSLHALATDMASKGRNGDSMLVHMTPGEVAGLHALALKHGGSLTTNPDTGLPEANFLKSILPILAGFALGPAGMGIAFGGLSSAASAGLLVGGVTGLATGSLQKGLMAGLGAYGGAGLGGGLSELGAGELAQGQISANMPTLAEGASQAQIADYAKQVNDLRAAGLQGASQLPLADKLSAGFSSATASPTDALAFAKQNMMPLGAAAAPIMADMMVPTTTKMAPVQSPGRIREKRWDGRQFVDVANTDANVYNTSGRSFSDFYRGYNNGGIVALAKGGAVPGYAEGDLILDAYQKGDYNTANRLIGEQKLSAQDVVSKYNLDAAQAAEVAKNLGYAGDKSTLQYGAGYVAPTPYTDQGITNWLQDFATQNLRNSGVADPSETAQALKDAIKQYNPDINQVNRILNSGAVVPYAGGSRFGGQDVNLNSFADEFAMATSKNPLVDANQRITLDPALATQAAQNELDTLFDPNKGSFMPIKNADFESGGKYYGQIGNRDKMIYDWYSDPANKAKIDAAQKTVFDKYGVPESMRLAPRALAPSLVRHQRDTAKAEYIDPLNYTSYDDYTKAQNAASLKRFEDEIALNKKYGIDLMSQYKTGNVPSPAEVSLANLRGRTGGTEQGEANFYGMTLEDYRNLLSGDKTKPMGQFASVYGTQLLSPIEQVAAQTARAAGLGTPDAKTVALAKKYPAIFAKASTKWADYLRKNYPGTLEYENVLGTTKKSANGGLMGLARGGIVALAAGGDYRSLTKDSSAEDIASAYKQFTTAGGGDTAANQQAAINYLTNLGIGQDKIGQAYGTYQASPTYTDYTQQNVTDYLTANKNANIAADTAKFNANPFLVNQAINEMASGYLEPSQTTAGSGAQKYYDAFTNAGIDANELFSANKTLNPNYAFDAQTGDAGLNALKRAFGVAKQFDTYEYEKAPGTQLEKDVAFLKQYDAGKFTGDRAQQIEDIARETGLSLNEAARRYDAARASMKPVVPPVVPPIVKPPVVPIVNTTPIVNATQNTTTNVPLPTDIYTAPSGALPVGVSGNTGPSQVGGGTTVNPNGTITTSPRIPNIPVGGFTGMQNLRDAYEKGGGSLGYTSPTYTPEEFTKKYVDRMSGDSKAAYDYLTGKAGATYPTKSGVGQIARPYDEAVLGYPARGNLPYIYNKTTGRMDPNPDYVAPGRDAAGNVTYSMSLNDVKKSLTDTPLSGQALYDWAMSNNLSAQQIADATGRTLSSVYADFRKGSQAAAKKKEDDKAAGITTTTDISGGGGGGPGPGPGPGPGDDGDDGGDTAKRGGLMGYADGGMMGYALGGLGTLGGYSDGGRLLRGPGDGVSDSIPATIGRKQQPARLADGEFVVPARIVSELGNGSTDAGAKKLYAMMDRVQRARGKTTGKNKVAANSRADKYLPA